MSLIKLNLGYCIHFQLLCVSFFIYFIWRLITLQYFSGFCHTRTRISHGCTCVPQSRTPLSPPSPSHPSGLSQCTGFECTLSWIEFGLVVLCAFFFKFYLMNNKNMVVSLILKIWLFLFYVTWSHRLEYFKTFNLKWIMGDHWGAARLGAVERAFLWSFTFWQHRL